MAGISSARDRSNKLRAEPFEVGHDSAFHFVEDGIRSSVNSDPSIVRRPPGRVRMSIGRDRILEGRIIRMTWSQFKGLEPVVEAFRSRYIDKGKGGASCLDRVYLSRPVAFSSGESTLGPNGEEVQGRFELSVTYFKKTGERGLKQANEVLDVISAELERRLDSIHNVPQKWARGAALHRRNGKENRARDGAKELIRATQAEISTGMGTQLELQLGMETQLELPLGMIRKKN